MLTGCSKTSSFLPEVNFLGLGTFLDNWKICSQRPLASKAVNSLFFSQETGQMPSLIASLMHTPFCWLQEWAFVQWCMKRVLGCGHGIVFPVMFKPHLSHKFSYPSTRERTLCPQKSLTCLSVHESESWSYCFLPFILVCCLSISTLFKEY
jgi:hypothetical protein